MSKKSEAAENDLNEVVSEAEPAVGTRAYYEIHPWETVVYTLPYIPGSDREDVFVSLNDKTYQIVRGNPVRIPWCVAQLVQDSIDQDRRTRKKIAKLIEGS